MTSHQHTVLVVEDEPLIRFALSDMLQDSGYRVLEASNVLEAISVLGFHRIDALISDIDMPGALNGIDLAKLVARCHMHTAIIMTSGAHDIEELGVPGAQFFPKPYCLEELRTLLGEMMYEREIVQPLYAGAGI
jgi:DNA-binding NtrC family response regulator